MHAIEALVSTRICLPQKYWQKMPHQCVSANFKAAAYPVGDVPARPRVQKGHHARDDSLQGRVVERCAALRGGRAPMSQMPPPEHRHKVH
jgi:hypothetical protein